MKRIHRTFVVLSMLTGLLSCAKEEGLPRLGKGEKVPASFGFVQELPKDIQTKTVIDSPSSFESKFTSITYGVYSGGSLYSSAYFSDAEGNLDSASTGVTLEKGFTFTVYVFVNMGDLTESLPTAESGVASMVYTIPAYKNSTVSDVNTRGIPMSGKVTLSPTTDALSETVSLRRLLARVTATLRCEWDGARIQEARVYNLNSKLKPFGTSAAESTGDILPFQDIQTGSDATTLTATFYVPENMQGVFSGITASDDKERNNALVTGIAGRLTYLETTVASTGRYEGTVKYRSYLGSNATSSFNIERNAHYHWTINYKSEKVDDYDNDWKHDMGEGLTVKDYSIVLSPNPMELGVGDVQTLSTVLRTTVENPVPGTTSSVLSNGSCTWESSDPTVASVSSTGVVTALKAGTATITARYTPSGYDFSQVSATTVVNVSDVVSNYIEILGGDNPSTVGTDIQLSAKYHTVTNNVDDGGVDITSDPSASWSKTEGPSCITVGTHTGTVASVTPGGTAVIRCTYAGTYAEKSVSFSSVVSYRLEVTATPSSVDMGSPIQMSAKFYTTTDGVEDAGVTVTSQTVWSRYSGDAVSISAAGVVTSPVAATAVINGSYTRDGVEYSAQAGVTFNHVATITHTLVISGASAANVGETISLTATYYTYTDGTPDAGVDKTSEATWTRKSGSANVTVGNASGTKGKVSAVSPGGLATVSCTFGTVTSNDFDVTFASVVDYELEVSATPPSQKVGSSIQMSARLNTIVDGNDNWEDLPASSVSWSRKSGSANVSVVASTGVVTNTVGAASAVIEGSYTIASRTVKASATVTFTDVVENHIEIVAETSTTRNVGETITLKAYYHTVTNDVDDGGVDVTTNASASWSMKSGSDSHISVGAHTGLVTAVTAGLTTNLTGTVVVSYSGKSAEQAVVFKPVVSKRLEVSAPSYSVNENETIQMSAKLYTTIDSVEDSGVIVTTSSSWSKSGSSSITVGNSSGTKGLVSATGAGTASITATYNDGSANYSDTKDVTFVHVPVITHKVIITGENSAYVGTPISLTATYYTYSDDVQTASQVVTTASGVSWSRSSGSTLVSVGSATGVVSCSNPEGLTGAKTATVTVTYAGITSDGFDVTFNPVVTKVLTVTATPSTQNVNSTIQMSATLKTTVDGVVKTTPLSASNVTWSRLSGGTDASRISVNASGVVSNTTGAATGTIQGTYDGVSGTASVTFNDVVTHSLVVTAPDGLTGTVGDNISLVATYYTYLNGSATPSSSDVVTTNGSLTWSKLSSGLIGEDNLSIGAHTGVVTATSEGSAEFRAQYAGETSNEVTVSFGNSIVKELIVSASPASQKVGNQIQLSAQLKTTVNGGTPSLQPVSATWSALNSGTNYSNISVNSSTGVVTNTVGAASRTIRGTYDGVYGDVTVTFTDNITYELELTPGTTTGVSVGTPVNLTATYYTLTNGTRTGSTDVTANASTTWNSSNTNMTVSSGVVNAPTYGGTTTITARYSGKAATATVTYNDVTEYVYSLEVSPASLQVKVSKFASVTLYLVSQRKVNGVLQSVTNSDKSIVTTVAWTSSNTAKAVWDSTEGKIKGVEEGTATLTATYTCPDSVARTASVSVTVLPLNSGFDDDWDDGGEINL